MSFHDGPSWGEPVDFLDPRLLRPDRPDDVLWLSLSDRIDCCCRLDRQDHAFARAWPWCHTYGSGGFDPETLTIDRPDGIYARRSVPIPGRRTPSGRPAYGSLFLHRVILTRAVGPPPHPLMVGDHVNGDTLDNRRCNLRWADRVMNARNVRGSAERERLTRELACVQLIAEAALHAWPIRATL